jgi:hypothetical protein
LAPGFRPVFPDAVFVSAGLASVCFELSVADFGTFLSEVFPPFVRGEVVDVFTVTEVLDGTESFEVVVVATLAVDELVGFFDVVVVDVLDVTDEFLLEDIDDALLGVVEGLLDVVDVLFADADVGVLFADVEDVLLFVATGEPDAVTEPALERVLELPDFAKPVVLVAAAGLTELAVALLIFFALPDPMCSSVNCEACASSSTG